MKEKLTAKESAAVRYYCSPGSESYNNWCESCKKANYSTSLGWKANAKRVHDKDYIQVAITEKRAEVSEKMDITTDEVIKGLRKLAGLDDGGKNLSNTDKLRSFELLGRHLGMFVDRFANETKEPALSDAENKALEGPARLYKLTRAGQGASEWRKQAKEG